jgi:hypothetical protein
VSEDTSHVCRAIPQLFDRAIKVRLTPLFSSRAHIELT